MPLTQTQLASEVAERSGLSKSDAKAALAALEDEFAGIFSHETIARCIAARPTACPGTSAWSSRASPFAPYASDNTSPG